jgi:pimeloyl-ACP methyl ester carboxylesterase
MKSTKILSLLLLSLISTDLMAQNFDIGHSTITFYDSARNRDIETEIYYPADNAGDNVPVALGNYPVLVFGHGFLMSWDAYENFWTVLVPEGYVMCFPTTEMGLSPNHGDLGLDLSFIAAQMQREHQDSSSLFFQALLSKTALMGHSMGGGASFLAAENDSAISTLVNFAAAETNPSAIAAAAHVRIPSLIFSGDDDCVTPPVDHQEPLYDALASACKTHVSIVNGGHCYFANNNFSCTLGETFCNPTLDISREAQHDVTFDFLKLWLAYTLYDQTQILSTFNDSLGNSTRVTVTQNCNATSIQSVEDREALLLFPNPVTDYLNVRIPQNHPQGLIYIYNTLGQKIYQQTVDHSSFQINFAEFPQGSYILIYRNESESHVRTILK